ncbi:MAG: hypothetical protein JSW05_08830 [Candidatus Thorarchaeota archaeon]|nr:MAG: hypothetical protein JSW05_08830 [Candidatus Thorarchaeota archaeon]
MMLLEDILNLFYEPFIQYVILVVILAAVAGVAARRGRGPKRSGAAKRMERMIGDIDKGRDVRAPDVKSRQSIITGMFESKMRAVGLEPTTESGYIPVSYTPLARFLSERGINDDIVSAITSGLKEEESEEDVRSIIEAAAGTPDVDLTPTEIEKAQELAVEEWTRLKGAG